MKIGKLKFVVDLNAYDIKALEGKPHIDGAFIHNNLSAWQEVVETEWKNWDVSEYLNDIQCRYYLQYVLDRLSRQTKQQLQSQIDVIDNTFKVNSQPSKHPNYIKILGASIGGPFFWELQTIHPGLQ